MKIALLSKIKLFWHHIGAKFFGLHLNYVGYWNERYEAGFSSGKGSYDDLAIFKAEIVNDFIKKNSLKTIIEFGCGDGNQLKLMHYEKYLGLDVAYSAIVRCRNIFSNDTSKSFLLYNPDGFVNKGFLKADLVICLDVLYHIIPEEDYIKTLDHIFSCSENYVILYTDVDKYKEIPYKKGSHIFHRNTLEYLEKFPDFTLIEILRNKYPEKSWADFLVLKRIS